MAELESQRPISPKPTPSGNQVTQDNQIDNLLIEHYAPVYRLAFAVLRDSEIAHRATIRTFVTALLDFHNFYLIGSNRIQSDLRIWLFRLALRAIQDEELRSPRKTSIPPDLVEPERQLWKEVDLLESKEFILFILHYVLGFKDPEAAAILRVSQSAVHTQLEIFREKFYEILRNKKTSRSRTTKDANSNKVSIKTYQDIEKRVSESLQRRWPQPQFSTEELENVVRQVKQLADKERVKRQQTAPYKWMAFIAGGILLIVLCIGLGVLVWLVGSGQVPGSDQPTAWGLKRNSTPLGKTKSLSKRSNSEDISLRLREGPLLWSTLWIDTQITVFGPQSYVGPPKVYRAQAWISQPDQSFEFFGVLSEEPKSEYMVSDGSSYYLNLLLDKFFTGRWDGNTGELLSNPMLRDLIFPGSGILSSAGIDSNIGNIRGIRPSWKNNNGSFNSIEYERVAGRRSLVVDWINQEGYKVERLWLDVKTGLILRWKEFGGENFETLVSETVVTDIIYNQPDPPPQVNDALKIKLPEAVLEWQNPTSRQNDPALTPTLAIPMTTRLYLFPEKAPSDYDPTKSRLVFQFPQDPASEESINNRAELPAEIFTDGYWLEKVNFGLPWVLRCDRSPDGKRLAFNTGSDGTVTANDSLRWFNLSEPQKIYLPLPGLNVTHFAFSPDSRRLAAFGVGETEDEKGVFLLEIGTGEYQLLINLVDAMSLVWSPDGEFLALIGTTIDEEKQEALVIHVDTGQIAYRIETEFLEEDLQELPVASWGVEFPVEMSSMKECALPP